MAKRALTLKQERFVKELPAAPSIAEAARRAGYAPKSARESGAETLALSSVQIALKAELQSLGLDQPDLERELAKAALHDPDEPITWNHKLEALKQVAKLRKYIDSDAKPAGDTYNQVVLQGFTLEQLRALIEQMRGLNAPVSFKESRE